LISAEQVGDKPLNRRGWKGSQHGLQFGHGLATTRWRKVVGTTATLHAIDDMQAQRPDQVVSANTRLDAVVPGQRGRDETQRDSGRGRVDLARRPG